MNGHAVCPFCGREVLTGGTEFGDSRLHDECYAALQGEMDEAAPETDLEEALTLSEIDNYG